MLCIKPLEQPHIEGSANTSSDKYSNAIKQYSTVELDNQLIDAEELLVNNKCIYSKKQKCIALMKNNHRPYRKQIQTFAIVL